MKFLAKLAALVGAAAFLFSSFSISPASAAIKKKMTVVHAHTRVLKSGKIVHVKAHMRAVSAPKTIHVKAYNKVTKTGKIVHVKAHNRKAPTTHKMGTHKMTGKMGKMHM